MTCAAGFLGTGGRYQVVDFFYGVNGMTDSERKHDGAESMTNENLTSVMDAMLDRLEAEQRISSRSVLSLEKIVAAAIMLVVTSVCLWMGNSVNTLNQTVIELRVTISHLQAKVSELKDDNRQLQMSQLNVTSTNSQNIQLIMERMKSDDVQEDRLLKLVEDMQRRMQLLESNKPARSENASLPH